MNEIESKRNFNAPVELLFKAWAQEKHLKNWWGPNGFSNSFHEFDFHNGGRWRFTMKDPDGKDYENESKFETVIENELVILHHISKPEYKAEFVFSPHGKNMSSLVWTMTFETEKAYNALRDIVSEKNEENLDRLEAELKRMKNAQ